MFESWDFFKIENTLEVIPLEVPILFKKKKKRVEKIQVEF